MRCCNGQDTHDGDHQADPSAHGGHSKAVYAYALEDAAWWQEAHGIPVAPGTFGENLTLVGLSLNDAVIGELPAGEPGLGHLDQRVAHSPTFGVLSGWTLLWCYLFIGIAGLSGFAIFSNQFLNAIGIHGTVPAIILFAVSAVLCWLVAFKDIRISSLLMLGLEAVSVTFILGLAFVVLFKHGFSLDTHQLALKGSASMVSASPSSSPSSASWALRAQRPSEAKPRTHCGPSPGPSSGACC